MNQVQQPMIAGKLDGAAVIRQVGELLARTARPVAVERRRHQRVPLPALFQLTPLDAQGNTQDGQAVTVVGKDISARGMSFFHSGPLTYRRAIVSLDHPELGQFAVEIDIRWCRFSRAGWYESGGRLLRALGCQPAPAVRGSAIPLAS